MDHRVAPAVLCATGISQRKIPAGFTLIELMVVLVVVGIMIGAATLMFSDPARGKFNEEQDRLVRLLQLVQEEAILQSRERAIGFWEKGYSFYEVSDQVDKEGKPLWNKMDDSILRARQLPAEMELQLTMEGRDIVMSSVAEDNPQIFVLSSGEMTPFSLTLSYENSLQSTLTVDALGKLEPGEIESPSP